MHHPLPWLPLLASSPCQLYFVLLLLLFLFSPLHTFNPSRLSSTCSDHNVVYEHHSPQKLLPVLNCSPVHHHRKGAQSRSLIESYSHFKAICHSYCTLLTVTSSCSTTVPHLAPYYLCNSFWPSLYLSINTVRANIKPSFSYSFPNCIFSGMALNVHRLFRF